MAILPNGRNWTDFKISSEPQKVIIAGEMTIHGVTNSIKEPGVIFQANQKVKGEAIFKIMLEDYDVKIPRILIKNIAESVEIKMNLELNKNLFLSLEKLCYLRSFRQMDCLALILSQKTCFFLPFLKSLRVCLNKFFLDIMSASTLRMVAFLGNSVSAMSSIL